jgi:hypothetical protein
MTHLCRLTRAEMWNSPSPEKSIRFEKLLWAQTALSFWTACSLFGFRRRIFRRILWTVVSDICKSALAQDTHFFETLPNIIHIFSRCPRMSSRTFFIPQTISLQIVLPSSNDLFIRWSQIVLMSKFTLNSNTGLKFYVPQHSLCFMLQLIAQNI